MTGEEVAFDVVIPTIGRRSLTTLLSVLDRDDGPLPQRLILADDRSGASPPLPIPPLSPVLRARVEIVSSGGRGPAAARNAGWRAGSAPWVVFVDDDVEPRRGWRTAIARDLAQAAPDVAGIQATVTVPLRSDRAPTDWERNVASLETARWITAEMAYRRTALEDAGGFDERFTRAYREDTDLALRVQALGWRLARGRRSVLHPVRPAGPWTSVRLQRGNADDVLMAALHPGYRDGPPNRLGRRRSHAVTVGGFAGAAGALGLGQPLGAAALLACWAALTVALAWRRIAPGPRTPAEVATMAATTIVIPFLACAWWIVGVVRLPHLLADRRRAPRPAAASEPAASLEAAS